MKVLVAVKRVIDFNVKHFTSEGGQVRPSRGMRAGPLELSEGEHTARAVTRLALLRTIGWPWPKNRNLASQLIIGLVNRNTTATSMRVVRPSVNANPFTLPMDPR